jgi:uncharacterized pyridoxamine 5'-phosphate oxidase family protein
MYDHSTNDGPTARFGHIVNVYHEKLYLYGGKNESKCFKDFWEFDPITLQWSKFKQSQSQSIDFRTQRM